MKNALILVGHISGLPVETEPTVLMVYSGDVVPAIVAAVASATVALNINVSASQVGDPAQAVDLGTVRVEDAVAIGDTLDISGDVYHKHV